MSKINSILLVDDDEATNFVSSLIIKRSGIVVELLIARNGREAIDLIRQRSEVPAINGSGVPDLILLDINMPVMDGFGFLEAFNALDFPGKESVAIAVLTTSLNPRDEELVRAAGVSDFLNKPLTAKILEDLLEKHFN